MTGPGVAVVSFDPVQVGVNQAGVANDSLLLQDIEQLP
jgi:hypothetical protein